jgi:hypothetical protein
MGGSITNRWRSRALVLPVTVMGLLVCSSSSFADETVQVCGSYANNVFASSSVPGITATGRCPTPSYNGGGFGLFNSGNTTRGQTGRWQTTAPAGLELVGATASQLVSYGINDGQDYGGGFYWAGGGVQTNDHTPSSVGMIFSSPSSYFGMQLVCGKGRCAAPAQLDVGAFSLYVRETSGPSLVAPIGLWQASGWVRGMWPFFAWGNSPSGLCSLSASLNGQLIHTATSAQDVSSWHQCAAPPIYQSVDSSRHGQGALPLTLSASDAAGVPAGVTKTVYVDNSQPVVSYSGPSDAPSTAGTQYVTANASGSPSGIEGLACSLDGGANQWYVGSGAQIAISGVGDHAVRCAAANNAVDGAGNHGWSNWATWSLSIREPTVSGIGFARLVHALLCHRVREWVRVPARWVTVRRHHRLVRVRKRAYTKVVSATHCHARVVRRRITVWTTVLRHGKPVRIKRHKTIRIVEFPHVIYHNSKWVGHGRRTTVSGWLGTPDGIALAGQAVHVLTAPDNGLGHFRQAAVAITAADGTWSATLRAGPSRLVEAYYAGAPTLEPSVSSPVNVVVPAKVKLLIVSPTRVPWGGTARIVGQLVGGYLPPGGALVRLRIGYGSAYTTYGVQEHVTGNGRFSTAYTFGLGDPSTNRTYWFQVASLPMGNYPWAPAASGKWFVTVGGHPSIPSVAAQASFQNET